MACRTTSAFYPHDRDICCQCPKEVTVYSIFWTAHKHRNTKNKTKQKTPPKKQQQQQTLEALILKTCLYIEKKVRMGTRPSGQSQSSLYCFMKFTNHILHIEQLKRMLHYKTVQVLNLQLKSCILKF